MQCKCKRLVTLCLHVCLLPNLPNVQCVNVMCLYTKILFVYFVCVFAVTGSREWGPVMCWVTSQTWRILSSTQSPDNRFQVVYITVCLHSPNPRLSLPWVHNVTSHEPLAWFTIHQCLTFVLLHNAWTQLGILMYYWTIQYIYIFYIQLKSVALRVILWEAKNSKHPNFIGEVYK